MEDEIVKVPPSGYIRLPKYRNKWIKIIEVDFIEKENEISENNKK